MVPGNPAPPNRRPAAATHRTSEAPSDLRRMVHRCLALSTSERIASHDLRHTRCRAAPRKANCKRRRPNECFVSTALPKSSDHRQLFHHERNSRNG
jgi:hypothetical protein